MIIDEDKLITEAFSPMDDEDLQDMAVLPDLTPDSQHDFDANSLDLGSLNCTPPMLQSLKALLEYQKPGLLSSSNGCPPPAIGAVCDLDLGDCEPIAFRARNVRIEYMVQLYDIIKICWITKWLSLACRHGLLLLSLH